MASEASTQVLTTAAGIAAGIFVIRTYDEWCAQSFAGCVAAGDLDDGERWARRFLVPWELAAFALVMTLLVAHFLWFRPAA